MATTLLPAIDPARTIPAEVLLVAGEAFAVSPEPAAPGPGDPDVPYIPAAPRRLGRRTQLLLTEPATHRPITTVETALVESVTFRYGPGSMSAQAAAIDPVWELLGSVSTRAYGRTVHKPDLGSVDWCIGVDGVRFESGVFREPQRGEGGTWKLSGDSAEAVFEERALGETEQKDFYGGRGSFPTAAFESAGWSKTDNVVIGWNTTSPFEGARSLVATATGSQPGRVFGPWVQMPAHPEQTRFPVASAIVRINSDLVCQIMCEVHAIAGGSVSPDFTIEERGVSDDTDNDYQLIAGRGRLNASPNAHVVRAVLVIPASGDDVDIDLVRIQWPTLTGYPNQQDLARYPGRILRDAQASAIGGSTWGIPTTILELCGVKAKITYEHSSDIQVAQAMNGIRDMNGGPDWRISPGWRCLVGPRGGYRFDVGLTPDNILTCEMNPDPGGQVHEFRGQTDIGSGTTRHVHAVNQPRRPTRRRVRQLAMVPDELSYDAGRRWTEGQAATAAQDPFTAVATIRFDEGLLITEGDVLPFAWVDGDGDDAPAFWGPVKVAERTFDFQADTCKVSVASGVS